MDTDGFAYADENGEIRAQMDADGFGYFDGSGTIRASMDADGFGYFDENGSTRAQLGVVGSVDKKTGMESRYPAGAVLFDDDNDVIWFAP